MMKAPPRLPLIPWTLLLVLSCAVGAAQTRISIHPEPKPELTLHVTTKQEFSISMDGGAASPDPAAAKIVTETLLGYKQANGRFDDQGRMESQLTIERIDMKQTLNGTAKSPGSLEPLLGRSMTAVFDRGGKLVDLQVPKDLPQANIVKQLVAAAYGALNFLSASAMSVGETETAPSTIPLRLSGGATPVPYQTRTVTTLRAVEKNGSDRIARFDQRIESATDTGLVKVNGTGSIDWNLDRGFVAASATEWTFEGGMAGRGSTAPLGTARGTMKVTVTAHE